MIRFNFTMIKYNKTANNIKKNLSIRLIMNEECANNLPSSNIKENLKRAIIRILRLKMIKNIHFKMVMVRIKDREMVIKDDSHFKLGFKLNIYYLNIKSFNYII